ncbi:ABC transporter ATP-binding protein [Nocardia sp. NPDC059177]|uniref:ABC transporter ATP-binding protein n=1 Tax=Nocardia sp. NPDC059177 TaxID=3346759 RepID=UPI0036AD5BE1
MTEPLISVRGLRVTAGTAVLIDAADLEIGAGEIVTLFGPSGAGKTTLATALAGIPVTGTTVTGQVRRRAAIRVGYLPQDAAATLNPARRIGTALGELARLRARRLGLPRPGRAQLRRRLAATLAAAAFDLDATDLDALARRYPFEFSGGERARLALAQVLTFDPDVLVMDEPTVGLDPIARATLLTGLTALRDTGTAVVLVTHDAAAVEQVGDRTLFVRDGRVHTTGDLPEVPAMGERAPRPPATPVLRLREVSVTHRGAPTLHGIDLELHPGELLAMIGVSGAGKSTIGRCIAGLVTPAGGEIQLDAQRLPPLRRRGKAQIAAVQYVWQESAASFDPRRTVLDQVAATAIRLRGTDRGAATSQAITLLTELGIEETQARRYPAGLSGGQLQRAALARALGAQPRVLVCDEITTALDQPLAQRVLDHLDDYRHRHGAAILSISHDLRGQLDRADRVAVVDAGRIVDLGTPAELRSRPAGTIPAGLLAVDARPTRAAGRIEACIPRT